MGENITASTVAFTSNIQPVKGSYEKDMAFLSSIHDPFALEAMKKLGYEMITRLQEKEYENAALHCAYAYEHDYPWGTIVRPDGTHQVVCKCTNTACGNFLKCRPDFDEKELQAEKENILVKNFVTEESVDESDKTAVEFEHDSNSDAEAAATLFGMTSGLDMDKEGQLQDQHEEAVERFVRDEIKWEHLDTASGSGSQTASFDSFADVRQSDIIELSPEERTIVNAGPGTGKTWTLIEKIKYMLAEEDIEPDKILVLCFSRAAVEVVRNRLENAADKDELPLNWNEVDVRTFDSFATYLLAWIQENEPNMLPKGFSLEFANYDDRIVAAVSVITEFTDLLAEYRHVIVDEVQDLVGVRAEMVLAMLKNLPETCGFTILGDSCQALYDYLAANDNTVMDSVHFYQDIFQTFKFANFYSLTDNHRQSDEFGAIVAPYREAILTGDADARTEAVKKISTVLLTANVDLKNFDLEMAEKYHKAGTLGVLTRTNGQALQISSWFRSNGIEHNLQKPLNSQDLAPWIGRVLMNTETDMIDLNEFRKLFSEAYPSKVNSAEKFWNALISTQLDQTKRHFEIEDLLRGLIQNARNPLLYEEPIDKEQKITISNIHRAKGREFDSVLVLDDVLEAMADEDKDDILEHKVCYVALTRPKKRIEKVKLNTQYIYISKDAVRRCFKSAGRPNHLYLSHIEVGEASDINERSFGAEEDIQRYIQKLPRDTRIKFIRCRENTKPYVVYKIVPEEDEHMVLGYTTASFARDIEKAIQRIYKNNRKVEYRYYPEIFNDIYLDRLNTCISAVGSELNGAKQIGDMFIWYGLEISGFAHRESTRY